MGSHFAGAGTMNAISQAEGTFGRTAWNVVRAIEWGNRQLGRAVLILVPALAVLMAFETVSRYVFDRPTLWANDLSYMVNGTLLMVPAGWALAKNVHVRVETFTGVIPRRAQDIIHIVFYVVLLLPGLVVLSATAWQRALHAYNTHELEQMSAWAPIVWPFYLAIAVGLSAFALQCVAEIIKHALGRSPLSGGGHV